MSMELTFRELKKTELITIKEINRSEIIHEIYKYVNGVLILKPEYCVVEAFDPKELEYIITSQNRILEEGGKVIGAFDNDTITGVASVENKKRGIRSEYCKMDILYVSADYRGKRIGHKLVEECKKIALNFGAKKLYISATPTKATIDFYRNEGAVITKEIDSDLFKLEPLDIHLEIDLT
ncbi:GNAT family N-acetyltransferase [Flavobacterium lindanitolerans]|uniref:GNAT family N-acetyltransferase n=1 Tax=Flavobacterium lindanitolerans TaxID=428988 RepID=UPI0027B9562A|nr:GNAT family N-acetyltransferase [Flavobacterium lindanitolerans]